MSPKTRFISPRGKLDLLNTGRYKNAQTTYLETCVNNFIHNKFGALNCHPELKMGPSPRVQSSNANATFRRDYLKAQTIVASPTTRAPVLNITSHRVDQSLEGPSSRSKKHTSRAQNSIEDDDMVRIGTTGRESDAETSKRSKLHRSFGHTSYMYEKNHTQGDDIDDVISIEARTQMIMSQMHNRPTMIPKFNY